MVITDKSGAIEWSNTAFSNLSGYRAEESLGTRPWDVTQRDADVATVASNREMWAAILAGRVWHGEVTSRRRDGTPYLQARTVTPVKHNDSEIAHFIAITEDLTDRRQLERQLQQSQKMETVGQLAGGVAHDFNNLLTVITATADSRPQICRRTIRCARSFARSARRRTGGDAHAPAPGLQPQAGAPAAVLNVNTVVANMERMLSRLIGEDILMEFAPAPDLGSVMVDAGQLEQVIMNLVVNARDAMPEGAR